MVASEEAEGHYLADLVEHSRLAGTIVKPESVSHWGSHRGSRLRKGFPWIPQGQIGKGAYSTVWKQKQENTGALRAIKQVEKNSLALDHKKEIEAMARLRKCPELFVFFMGWYEDDKHVYLAMNYFDLGDLSMHLDPIIAEDDVRKITKQLLQGLKYMHGMGLVHRDLKPQNIFVLEKCPWSVRIGDFGIAKRLANDETITTTTPRGTRPYMAPERDPWLLDDDEPHKSNQAVDLCSLGVIAFQMLTLVLPFGNGSVRVRAYYQGNTHFPEQPLLENSISDVGIDFVKALLNAEPEHRPSVEDTIDHTWMSHAPLPSHSSETKSLSKRARGLNAKWADGIKTSGCGSNKARFMVFSPDSSLLAVGHDIRKASVPSEHERDLVIYDVQACRILFSVTADHCHAISFSDDGLQLVAFFLITPQKLALKAWDVVTWNVIWRKGTQETIDTLHQFEITDSLSAARYWAACWPPGHVQIWNSGDRKGSGVNFCQDMSPDVSLKVHHENGRLLLVNYRSCLLKMWKLATAAEVAIQDTVPGIRSPSALSTDARLLVFSTRTGLTVHDLFDSNGSVTLERHPHWGDDVRRILFSQSGRFIATTWELLPALTLTTYHEAKTGRLIESNWSDDCEIACSPDDRFIACGLSDGLIELWDPRASRTAARSTPERDNDSDETLVPEYFH